MPPSTQILPASVPIMITVINQTDFSIALPPPIGQVIQKRGKITLPIYNEIELNQADIARAVDKGWIVLLIAESQQGGEKSLVLDPVRRGELSYCDHFSNLSADGTIIHARVGLLPPASVNAVSFSGGQIDQPRTIRVVVVGSVTGAVVLHSVLATGTNNIESIEITSPGSYESIVAPAVIQSIDFPLIPAGASITVTTSSKLGLSGLISSYKSVFKVIKNGRDFQFMASEAVNAIDGTFDTGSIADGDDFTIRYKP